MTDKPSPHREDFTHKQGSEPLRKLDALRKAAFQRVRRPPTPKAMARRRSRLTLAKWALPSLAGVLLASIAIWPELNHLVHQDRAILREMRQLHIDSGAMEHAVYRDIDSHNHPYTLTAQTARQLGDDRINLNHPEADIMLPRGEWMHIRADRGVYLQHEQTLNLDGHVVMYRNDGTLLNTPSADMDMKQQVITTHEWVHAEGPFGTQDAQSAFLDQEENIVQFMGPGLTNRFNDLTPHPPSVSTNKRP
ncbi:LPS export ABC transporter periplasmic protein LptC [Saccharibacter floricola]|uniref:LPS export ABC transporter periplasmic protein LptC n=1 Tax=Saccharibacter floricola DSM 15669 TaxID=1123227 RepID=A0ABQ0NYN9_9PROT|nr:LPS export ABC transporter periplasmic protein LptC [Saccharibacter floricola]GBQ06752.1 hypothetical protein AA15669_1075 [Saccharibacter floricola DSM 15669]